MLALLSVSLVALSIEYAHAQVVSFARTYGGGGADEAHSVQQTSDGGYIAVGVTYGFGAGNGDFFLIKTDANGNLQWAKTYGGTDIEWAFYVQQTSDNGYILAGTTFSFGVGGGDVILIKTDANGNLQWAKTYGGTNYENVFSVQQTSDIGYIAAGYTSSFGAGMHDAFLIKTDAFGNLQWAKTYGGAGDDLAYSFQQTSDGGYIVAGWTNSFGAGDYDLFLIKTDAFGNLQWAKAYGGADADKATSVLQTSDGGYIVAGWTNSFGAGDYDLFLIKTDAFGNLQWAKTYGGAGDEYTWTSLQQTSDGGYIVAGWTNSFGAGDYDLFLIKTDAFGNLQWAKTYRGAGDEWRPAVRQTSDGGYIVVSYTTSFGAGLSDAFLVKTDANGNIGSCGIVRNVNPTVTIISPIISVSSVSPSVSSPDPTVTSPDVDVTSPTIAVSVPCFLSISESCQIASGLITPYKGGIKVSGSGELEVKVYNVSGVMVKFAKGKDEVKLELSRGVYFVEFVSGGKVLREKVVIR
jgi:hypothetical protein